MEALKKALLRIACGEIVPESWNIHSSNNHEVAQYPAKGPRKVEVPLDFENCFFYQAGLVELMNNGEGLVGEYSEWGGSEARNPAVKDMEYDRFCWLVEDGEEVECMTPLARIRTKNPAAENYYWMLLVAPCDGVVKKLCGNGIRSVGHGEVVAVLYETEEDCILDACEEDIAPEDMALATLLRSIPQLFV